jgi:hypothetical protein
LRIGVGAPAHTGSRKEEGPQSGWTRAFRLMRENAMPL